MFQHASLPPWNDQTDAQQRATLHLWVQDLYRYTMAAAFFHMRQQLLSHIAADEKEAADVQLILALMAQHAMIFSPLCEVCHFTGSALVMDGQGRLLLHYHKKLGRWLQFGGHPEHEMDMTDVALREAREESGLSDLRFWKDERRLLDVDVHAIPATATRPEHLHLDLRYLLYTNQPTQLQPLVGESEQLQWFRQDELAEDTLKLDPALRRLIKKAYQCFQEQRP